MERHLLVGVFSLSLLLGVITSYLYFHPLCYYIALAFYMQKCPAEQILW